MERKYCSAIEAAQILGCSVPTIYDWRDADILHQEAVGKRKYFLMEEVAALREKRIAAGQIKGESQPAEVPA